MDRQLVPLDFVETTSPGTPASGFVRVYARPDGILYGINSEGVETALTNKDAGKQEVFVGETPEIAHPAISFSPLTIGEVSVFEMKVNVP